MGEIFLGLSYLPVTSVMLGIITLPRRGLCYAGEKVHATQLPLFVNADVLRAATHWVSLNKTKP